MNKSSSLGPLEREVMNCLWNHKETTVRQVYECLNKRRKIAYTTVMTILFRLNKKGVVKRNKTGKAYAYVPRVSKKQIAKRLLRNTLDSLTEKYGTDAVVAFADELRDLPEKKRKELINILKEKKK